MHIAILTFDGYNELDSLIALGAQCSGTLVLAKLGLLEDIPACTDLTTAPWVRDAGVTVLEQPFFARGTIATAGGCLAAHYLAAWVIARLDGLFTKSGPRLHRCRRVPRLGWSSAEGCKP